MYILLFVALQYFSWLFKVAVAPAPSQCRCLYGQPCWPSSSDFSSLRDQVSQPLIHPVPPASACYPLSHPSGNCTDAQTNRFDGNWRSNQSGSMQLPNFETFTFKNGTISACYMNTTLGVPCEQGSVPIVGVDARSVGDIQAAVKFAVEHNLRLVVKNTGHDLLGRSTARDSFMIWTHHLKNIAYNSAFVPKGAPSTEIYEGVLFYYYYVSIRALTTTIQLAAMTLGAGVQWHEAYDAVQAQGRVLVGGISIGGSVGAAGGWVQGGGHSVLSPTYGLGVDNVIEFDIVTSTGEYLTANSHSHPDLFWALRGGGGGTYGIVTSATYRTHPSVPLTAAYLIANTTNNATFKTLFTEFVRMHPALSDAGFAGYVIVTNNSIEMIYIGVNMTQEQANKTIDPLFAFANNLTSQGLNVSTAITVPYPSFYEWYIAFFSAGGELVGFSAEGASRLISRDTCERNPQGIVDAVLSLPAVPGFTWIAVAGGAVSRVDPDSVGLNPAWRKALVHVTWGEVWPEGTPSSEIKRLREVLALSLTNVSAVVGSSAYFNEASVFEPNPQYTFFGSHYDKLKAIKNVYDPVGLFIVTEGVGSDDWDTSLNCRRK